MQLDTLPLKTVLEKEECKFHHEAPAVRIVNGYIEITACCDSFHKKLEMMMDDIATHTNVSLEKA